MHDSEPQADEQLRAAAADLLAAAMRYWKEYRRVTGGAAVVWVGDTNGELVVLTRGEYRDQLMVNIDNIMRQRSLYFGAARG